MDLHREIELEKEICSHLGAHGWLYEEGDAARYDRKLALFPADLVEWVKATQPDAWEALAKNHGATAEATLLGLWQRATWMAIIIKRAAKLVPPPEPLVPRPQELEVPAQKAAPEKKPPSALPMAESQEQMRAHPGKFRAPQPTGCTCCGHLYAFPCHGQNPDCMNKRFADARAD